MNFVRRKKRGSNSRVRKHWFDGNYRIVWRREAFGIELPPLYQASVRTRLPNGRIIWDRVSTRRAYKTLKAAIEACEKHAKLWEQASEATGIRKIEDIFGRVPLGVPIGVKLKRNVSELLTTHFD
jgi:hypothetical protein